MQDQDGSAEDDFGFSDLHNDDDDPDEKLDHLEDYEDIESLDKRISGYDRDTDDY